MRLDNKIAIVTGGGNGIGKAIALRLALAGADVTVVGPNMEELAETSDAVRKLGRRSSGLCVDVSQEPQVAAMTESVLSEFGRVDILVNNAGIIGPTATLVNISQAEWDEVLAVNLTGAFICSKAVLASMIEQRSGSIINIASVVGKMAYPLRAPYAVSKWGLIGLTLTLAKEVGTYHIRVNAVCPGPVAGERMKTIIERRAQELGQSTEEVEQMYVEKTALKRMVEAEDVAKMVTFLASDEGKNITGQAIDVSAGYAL